MQKPCSFALSLALLCLTGSAEAVRLPEPPLPACLIESARQFGGGDGFGSAGFGLAVGRFEFARKFMEGVQGAHMAGLHRKALRDALGCASDAARSLREAVNTIRRINEMETAK